MQCFEVDFNNPKPFAAVEFDEADYRMYSSPDELPKVGEEVFIYSPEIATMKSFITHVDAGFGYVTTVKEIRPCVKTENCLIIEFDFRPGS